MRSIGDKFTLFMELIGNGFYHFVYADIKVFKSVVVVRTLWYELSLGTFAYQLVFYNKP